MCGIWFYLKKNQRKLTNEVMNNYMCSFNKIKSRGPDVSIIKKITYNNSIHAIAGFHRLAIMDTSHNGDQPFYFVDTLDEILVICNGEIYNYKELIKDHDLHPKSQSDCEVIMELYKKYNNVDKIVKLLNGEFSFVIYHREIEKNKVNLFASTDPISVRPLFIGYIDNEYEQSDIFFCSEMKGLECCDRVERFKPGHVFQLSYTERHVHGIHQERYHIDNYYPYYDFDYKNKVEDSLSIIYANIVKKLSNAVKKRIQSDRPIGCLLSGGLDSSLVACLLARHMKQMKNRKTITFFSIGAPDSPDVINAIKVFNHIKETINSNVIHSIFDISFKEALDTIPNVIERIETFDITTIRASTWQYLLAKKISETSDIKVILNGDGADEVEMGYQYFKNAPNPVEAQIETEKLVKDIHLYDCLRVDRAISGHGLEARVPFLDIEFFDYYMRIPSELKTPVDGMEKYLIRKAFEVMEPDLLCKDVLWRRKEAFSDGVSKHIKSWYEIIQDRVEEIVTDMEYNTNKDMFKGLQPVSKESYYFRKIYESKYRNRENVINYYWLPNWCGNIKEPSARVLTVYKK
jgi:asparagine synthase (glutamine-hydrolysing)